MLKISTEFGVAPQSFCENQNSLQDQTYISYIEDTHQILFGSASSFESYCVHMKSPRT